MINCARGTCQRGRGRGRQPVAAGQRRSSEDSSANKRSRPEPRRAETKKPQGERYSWRHSTFRRPRGSRGAQQRKGGAKVRVPHKIHDEGAGPATPVCERRPRIARPLRPRQPRRFARMTSSPRSTFVAHWRAYISECRPPAQTPPRAALFRGRPLPRPAGPPPRSLL